MRLEVFQAASSDLFTTFAFSSGGNPIDVGTVSDVVTVDIWNERATAGSDASGVQIGIQALTVGGLPSVDLAPIVGGWIQARVTDALGSATLQSTDWQTVGGNLRLDLDTLGADSGRRIELRLSAPTFGVNPSSYNFYLEVLADEASNQGSSILDMVNFRGVVTGIGDYTFTGLWLGGEVIATDTPDVTLGDVEVITGGILAATLQATETFNDTASDGATAAGESYLSLIAWQSGFTVTKGAKGLSPRGIGDRPALPIGHIPLAWIEKRNGDDIHAADIVDARVRHLLELATDAASLTAYLQPGRALVGDRVVRLPVALPVALTASTTALLCLHPDRSLTLTADRQGLPLWEVTTDGIGVTGAVDVRRLCLACVGLSVDLGGACSVPAGEWTVLAVCVTAGTPGLLGTTTYEVKVDGVTLYTSSGTVDRRPILPAGVSYSGSLPEVRTLQAGQVLTLTVAATAGTAPAGVGAQIQLAAI